MKKVGRQTDEPGRRPKRSYAEEVSLMNPGSHYIWCLLL